MDFSFVTDPRFKELDREAQRRVFNDIAGADDRLAALDLEAKGRVLDDVWQGVMTPEDRGTLGRLGSKFVRGVGSAVDLAGGAVQMFDAEAKDQGTIADLVGGKIRKAGEWIAGTEMAQPDKFELSGKEGWIEKSVGGAAESLPSSLAPWGAAAAGAAIGGAIGGPFAPVTATAGGIIGMGAGLFGLFGAGTYKTEYDKVSKERRALGDTPDTADKVAADTAFRMAFGETAGEMVGDAAAYLIFGRSGKLAKDTLESTMKSLVSTGGLKQFAKNVGKDIPFEVGSEIGTAAYQAEAYQKAGLPTMSPADAAIEAIGPALFLSVGIGGAVQGKTALDGRALLRDLNDMQNPKGRAAAAGEMATSLRGKLQDKSVADAWAQTAFGYIERGEEIPVNSTVADFASQHKVTQDDTEPPDSIMDAASVDEAIQAAQDAVHRRAEMSITSAAILPPKIDASIPDTLESKIYRQMANAPSPELPPRYKTGQESEAMLEEYGQESAALQAGEAWQEQNPAVVYSRPFKSKSGAIMSLNQRKRAGSLVGDYDVVPTKDGMWRIESVGQGTAKELPERLAAAVGKPEQVKTLEQMGVIDPEAQTKEIVRDAITQHMDIATMLRNRGLETEANKHEAIAKENGEKLKVADGATTERVVDAALETSKNKKEVVPGGEETYDAYGREEGRQGEGLLSPSTVEPVSATAPALSPITIDPHGTGIIVKGDTAQVRAKLSAAGVKPKGLPNAKKGGLVFTERQAGAVRAALEDQNTPVRETQADLSIKSEKQKEAPNAQTDQVVLATPVPETGEDAPAVAGGNKGNEGGVSDAAAGGVKEPWQMTREEYAKQGGEISYSAPTGSGAHRDAVEEAFNRGEKISPEVLKDYPWLAARESIKPYVENLANLSDKELAAERKRTENDLNAWANKTPSIVNGRVNPELGKQASFEISEKMHAVDREIEARKSKPLSDLTPQGAIKAQPSPSDESAITADQPRAETVTAPSETARPASEMTAAELLRAAADRIDAAEKPATDISGAATEKPAEGHVDREDATEKTDKGDKLYSKAKKITIDEIVAPFKEKGVVTHIFESDKAITVQTIIVPKGMRKQGVATDLMRQLVEYADSAGKMMTVTPAVKDDYQGTTSHARLQRFYKRFGFVENKGRNKDFTINATSMYRNPTVNYSKTTTKTGTTVAQVETELRTFLKRGYDKLTGSGKLRVVQSVAELEKLQPSSAKGSSDSLSGHTKMFSNFIKGNPGIHEADGLVNVPREPSAKRDTFDPMVMKIGSYGVLGSPDEIRNLLDSGTIDKEIFGSFDVKRNSIIPSVSRVSPNTGQPANDGVRRDLEMLRNLLNSKTYTKKGVGGFNTPTQLFVISRVAHVVQNNQVFDAVVSSIPVDMMNVLMGKKISPKVVSHYKSMLLNALTSPNINHDISAAVYRSLSKVLSHLSPHEINSVYNDIFSIPQGEDTVKSIGGIAGSYSNGVMVLVADHIKNDDVKNILLHEGLHSLMREDAIFSKQHDAILDQFEAKRKYDYRVQDAFRRVPDDTPAHLVREEALAYFIESKANHTTSLFKKIMANIRMWLMRMGIPLKNLTTDDLVAMVVQGVRRMENQDHIVDGNKMVGDLAPALFSKASSPDDLLAKVKGVGSVAKQGKIENELPIEERWQKVQRVMQDKYNRWGVIKEWAEKQGFAFTDASDVPAHLDTMNGRIADQLLRFMEQTIEPLLERAAKIGATNEQIEKFLLAQHAKEANARAQKLHDNPGALAYGMTDEQAATIMATRGDDFKALANDFRKLSDDTLDMQLEAGVISQESYDAMKGAYKLYVPVRGGDDDIKRGTGKGLTVGRDSKRRGGHGEREEHVLENIVKMREFAVRQIEKNKTALSIKEMLTEMSDERVGTVGKPELTRVFKDKPSFTVLFQNSLAGVFDNEIDADRFVDKALASKMGTLDDYLIKTSTDPRISMMATPLLADNEIAYYESGKRGRIQLNDEGLAKASTHRDLDQLGTILQIGRTFNNYLSRAYTGYDPRFTIRNTFRDFTAGMINVTGDYGIGLAGKVAKAYPAMAKELWSARKDPAVSKWVDMYRQDGGSTGASYLPSIDRLGNKLQNIFEEKIGAIETYKKVYAEQIAMGKNAKMAGLIASSKSGMAGMKKVPVLGHALKVIERMNAISENAFRLAVYKTVYEQTNSRLKAAQAAKNSTLNFDKKGELGPQLSALWLFYNPAAQSMHRTLHTLLASEHKHQAQALVGSMVMTGLIAAMAFGDDDDEWDAIPKATKNRNLILGVGGGAAYITLPLPYEYGAFVGIGYAMADAMRGKATASTGVNLASAIVEGMSPFGNPITEQGNLSPYQMMPTAVQMITAPETNLNSFGGPIAPRKFDEGAPDFQNMWKASQGSAYASIARGLTKATGGNDYEAGLIDVSPETLKYYARGLMGGAFTFMDQVLHAGRVAAAGEVPDLYETPMVNVLGRKTSVRDYQSKFFEEAAEIKRKASAYKDALKNRDFAAAREIGDPSLLRAAKKIEKISKVVGSKRKAISAIRMDDSLSFEAKRRMISKIEEEEKDLLMKVVGD